MLLHRKAQTDLIDEGMVASSKGGGMYAHPLVSIVKTLMSDIKAIRMDLQIHGRGKNGEARDVGKRRGQRKAIQNAARETQDGDGSKDSLFNGE